MEMPWRLELLLGAATLAATTGSAAAAADSDDARCIDKTWLWLIPVLTLFVIVVWCLIVWYILQKRKNRAPGKVFPADSAKPAPGRPVPPAAIFQQQQQQQQQQQDQGVLPSAARKGIKAINNQNDWTDLFNTSGGKLVVVYFSATWCVPCKTIAPRISELANEHSDCIFAEVDVEHNEAIKTKCGVTSMPTFQFFINSDRVDELVGAKYDELVIKLTTEKAKATI